MSKATVTDIDALLPQTQCGQCGYQGCRPYAEAILNGTPHNQCPPGGQKTISKLSALLKRDALPLNPENGTESPRKIAVIREDECIGCTKCIQACPVDAIIGAAKLMHTVINDECTGCNLCVEPCPMDCIEMIDSSTPLRPNHYRMRFNARKARLQQLNQAEINTYQQNKQLVSNKNDRAEKLAYIEAAILRVKNKRAKL